MHSLELCPQRPAAERRFLQGHGGCARDVRLPDRLPAVLSSPLGAHPRARSRSALLGCVDLGQVGLVSALRLGLFPMSVLQILPPPSYGSLPDWQACSACSWCGDLYSRRCKVCCESRRYAWTLSKTGRSWRTMLRWCSNCPWKVLSLSSVVLLLCCCLRCRIWIPDPLRFFFQAVTGARTSRQANSSGSSTPPGAGPRPAQQPRVARK